MRSYKKQLPDTEPIFVIVQNDESIWEYVYHKYAPTMYGIIFQMTGDKTIAEEILESIFLELKEKKTISKIHPTLCIELLRHTYEFSSNHLKKLGLLPANAQPFDKNYPLINQFCFELNTLKEAAIKSAMSEPQMLQQLQVEFMRLRNLPTKNVGIM